MQPSLTLEEFLALAQRYAVVPVAVEVLGDVHTPVSVFRTVTRPLMLLFLGSSTKSTPKTSLVVTVTRCVVVTGNA